MKTRYEGLPLLSDSGALHPLYHDFEPTTKLFAFQSTAIYLLMRVFEDGLFFGMPQELQHLRVALDDSKCELVFPDTAESHCPLLTRVPSPLCFLQRMALPNLPLPAKSRRVAKTLTRHSNNHRTRRPRRRYRHHFIYTNRVHPRRHPTHQSDQDSRARNLLISSLQHSARGIRVQIADLECFGAVGF